MISEAITQLTEKIANDTIRKDELQHEIDEIAKRIEINRAIYATLKKIQQAESEMAQGVEQKQIED